MIRMREEIEMSASYMALIMETKRICFSVLVNCLKIERDFILTTSKFQDLTISNCHNL